MTAPFRLDEGLWLEGRDVMIPWLTPRKELMSIGEPDVEIHGSQVMMSWSGSALGGLANGFGTHLSSRSIGRRHWHAADRLAYARVFVANPAKDPRVAYAALCAHFEALLGRGRHWTDGGGYPITDWQIGPCQLSVSIGERMMEFCQVMLFHADFIDPRSA